MHWRLSIQEKKALHLTVKDLAGPTICQQFGRRGGGWEGGGRWAGGLLEEGLGAEGGGGEGAVRHPLLPGAYLRATNKGTQNFRLYVGE